MVSQIKGITVTLYERAKVGEDDFAKEVYEEKPVQVENVLVSPVEASDIAADLQLYGKRAEYELCIPKEDAHIWEDSVVEFFGKKWRTFGFCREWIEHHLPLDWNKKIRVERYG